VSPFYRLFPAGIPAAGVTYILHYFPGKQKGCKEFPDGRKKEESGARRENEIKK
jgi:hypothetical protein